MCAGAENPTYSGSLAALEPIGCRIIKVDTDGNGMIPEHLEEILGTWDVAKQGSKPKVTSAMCLLCDVD